MGRWFRLPNAIPTSGARSLQSVRGRGAAGSGRQPLRRQLTTTSSSRAKSRNVPLLANKSGHDSGVSVYIDCDLRKPRKAQTTPAQDGASDDLESAGIQTKCPGGRGTRKPRLRIQVPPSPPKTCRLINLLRTCWCAVRIFRYRCAGSCALCHLPALQRRPADRMTGGVANDESQRNWIVGTHSGPASALNRQRSGAEELLIGCEYADCGKVPS
jgi:hypothetical protein